MAIMNKGIIIAAGLAAIALAGSPASAVTMLNRGTLIISAPNYSAGDSFIDVKPGAFDITYAVDVLTSGDLDLAASLTGGTLTSVKFDGVTYTPSAGTPKYLDMLLSGFKAGNYSLDVTGVANALKSGFSNASIGVNLSLNPAAVPETATWAMMIAGIGFVGGAMRRRAVRTSVSFA